jgi:hypothetical protein
MFRLKKFVYGEACRSLPRRGKRRLSPWLNAAEMTIIWAVAHSFVNFM